MVPTSDVPLRTTEDLDSVLADPSALLIFKHSTRCPISAHAAAEYESWVPAKGEVRTAVVLVVEDRPLSQEIARRLKVTHQSPQVLLVQDGTVVFHASHDRITREALAEATGSLKPPGARGHSTRP